MSKHTQLNILDLEIHPVAKKHRSYSEEEFVALKEDISRNGQLVDILVYRGRCIDGRHRLKALSELGIMQVNAKIIPNNTTLKELEQMALSSENRRTDTPAQKAIKAWYWLRENKGLGITAKDALKKFAVKDAAAMTHINKMESELGLTTIGELYKNGVISMGYGPNTRKFTNLKRIYEALNKPKPDLEPLNRNKVEFDEDLKEGFAKLDGYAEDGNITKLAAMITKATNLMNKLIEA